jgi:hypothetical protein
MDSGASAAGAAAAAIAQAAKASGVIVRVEGHDFLSIVERADSPLVVYAKGGFLSRNHQYLTSYKGLAFFTKSSQPLPLPAKAELVTADKIWIPG